MFSDQNAVYQTNCKRKESEKKNQKVGRWRKWSLPTIFSGFSSGP